MKRLIIIVAVATLILAGSLIGPTAVMANGRTVDIDIKPGNSPNSINTNSNGKIPVAILTTEDFDATTVDPETVRFGSSEAAPVQYATEDVDSDGDLDLILHFNTQETGIAVGDTEATLIGITFDGEAITGIDSVRTDRPEIRFGACTELAYDDGSSEVGVAWNVPDGGFAVEFSPPEYPTRIVAVELFFHALNNPSDPIRLEIRDNNLLLLYAQDLTIYASQAQRWIVIDLRSENLRIKSGAFFVAVRQLVAGDPDIGSDTSSSPAGQSWQFYSDNWQMVDWTNYMIRAIVR